VETALTAWGIEVLRDCAPIAAVLDEATRGRAHRDALAVADERLRDPERTPSARVLAEIRGRFDNSHLDFALAWSLQHRGEVLALPLSDATAARLQRMADESLAAQRAIEAADSVPFEAYRQQYLAQDLMSGMPT
jgi:glutamate--cysteine ligase